MTVIVPKYKVIYTYDVRPSRQGEYSQFALGEFVPGLQTLGLYITGGFLTAYGEYPSRLAEFVAEDWDKLLGALESEQLILLEDKLQTYTLNYHRKVVHFRPGFQF